MTDEIKNKVDSIDKSKLNAKTKELFELITKGLKSKDSNVVSRAETQLNRLIKQAKDKNADIFVAEKTSKASTQGTASQVKSRRQDLFDAIQKDPKLSGFNKFQSVIEIDAERIALPRGKRVSKKGWKNQYGKSTGGRTYYETRENRMDRKAPIKKSTTAKPWLEYGGEIEEGKYIITVTDKNGVEKVAITKNSHDEAMAYATLKKNVIGSNGVVRIYNDEKECVYTSKMAKGGYMADGGEVYYVNDFYPNYDEDKIAKILKENGFKKVRKGKKYGWSNQPDVVIFEGDKNMAKDILEKEFDNYISINGKDWGRKYEDGGYMAKGGDVHECEYVVKFQNQDSGDIEEISVMAESEKDAIQNAYDESGLSDDYKFLSVKKYNKGGYMAKGGNVYSSDNAYQIFILKNGERVDSKIVRARNKSEARMIFEDRFGDDMEIEITEAPPKMVDGGYMAKGGRIQEEGDYLLGYEPYFDKNVWIAHIDRENKIVSPTSGYYPKHPMSKKAINWAKNNGYDYIADGKKYEDGGYMAKGGKIVDQYEGRTAEDIWNNLSKSQRSHFLYDHAEEIEEYRGEEYGELTSKEIVKAYNSDWNDLDKNIKNRFANHTREGQYEHGGETDEEGVDLFEDYDDQPQEVQDILEKYDFEDADYQTLKKLKIELNAIGYTFDYDMDGSPYDLRKIGQKGKSEFYAKGGTIGGMSTYVSARDIQEIKLTINGNAKTLKGSDLIDGVYVKKALLKPKFDAYEVYNKLSDIAYGVWDKLKIESGSQIYNSDAIQKKLQVQYEKEGIDSLFKSLNKIQRKKVAKILTDENQHSLRNYLALRGYEGEMEYNNYKDGYDDMPKGRKYYLSPYVIKRVVTMEDGAHIGFEALAEKVAKKYEGKKVAPKYQKEYGKTYSKEEAKDVGNKVAYTIHKKQGKMAKGGENEWFDYSNANLKKLPYGLDKYFIKTPNTKRLLMSTLQPTCARKEGVKNANKLMMDAYNGKVERRKPISVKRVRGKYEIIDGNSTFANAKFSGWKFIYADVTKNPTSSKGDSIFEIAKKIRKENEPWKEAVKRANQMKKNG